MVVMMRRRIAPFYRFLFFSCCPPIFAAMLCSSQFTKSLAKIWKRLGCVHVGVEEWRRFGSSIQTTPSHSISPFQHGQLFDPSFLPFLSSYSCSVLTGLLSVIVFFPPERSFLAYAFPLLDMCSPRLSYLYLSSFPISALSTHVLLFLSLMIITTTTFYLLSPVSKKIQTNVPTYFRPVLPALSSVNTLMCIACFG